VSRKSVPFGAPNGSPGAAGPTGGGPRAPDVIEARSDEWVSDRNSWAKESAARAVPGLLLDLAAERSLTEIVMLSMFTPVALGWFWLIHAMSWRARF
jgi:hypothetical protein